MNAASTPEFKNIMRRLAARGLRGGSLMKTAWAEYRKHHHGSTSTIRRKCGICGKLYAPGETKHFHNPRKKRKMISKPACRYCGTKSVLHGGVCLHCLKQNPKKKNTYTVFCKSGGCQFLKTGLTKEQANRETVSHQNMYQHDTAINEEKKNPIAIYNPIKGKPLPMSVIEIRYKRSSGAHSGQLFKHRFKARPHVYGLPDGSLRIVGSTRLWGEA